MFERYMVHREIDNLKSIYDEKKSGKGVKSELKKKDVRTLDKIYKGLRNRIKEERQKLKPLENSILYLCDETMTRSSLRRLLLEDKDSILKRYKNKPAADSLKYKQQVEDLTKIASEYQKNSVNLLRLEKILKKVGAVMFKKMQSDSDKVMKPLDQSLHDAIETGNLAKVKDMVKQGADVNATNVNDCTSLHIAVIANQLDIAEYLLKHKAKVNVVSFLGNTPLHLANTGEFVRILLDHHADINALNYNIETPLAKTISNGNIEAATCLVEHGADIHMKDGYGFNPFYLAASKGDKNLMTLLASKGANVNGKTQEKNTPLHGAVLSAILNKDGDMDVVRHLIHLGGNVCAINDIGMTPLYWVTVAKKFNPDGLQLLATKKSVNLRNTSGETVLHDIVCTDKKEAVKYLVENVGADLNIKDHNGDTPLHAIAGTFREASVGLVRYLVEHGANVDAVNNKNQTPADVAAVTEGKEEVRKYLAAVRGTLFNSAVQQATPVAAEPDRTKQYR